jgi:hypothetical protein
LNCHYICIFEETSESWNWGNRNWLGKWKHILVLAIQNDVVQCTVFRNCSTYPTGDPYAGLRVLQHWCVLLSRTHCKIYNNIFFHIRIWWYVLWFWNLPALLNTQQFEFFVVHFGTLIPSPKSHSLHFTCTLFCILCVENKCNNLLWRNGLSTGCWSLPWAKQLVSLPQLVCPRDDWDQVNFQQVLSSCIRASQMFLYAILTHDVKRRRMFKTVISNILSFFFHFAFLLFFPPPTSMFAKGLSYYCIVMIISVKIRLHH